uniref:histone H1-like n=1 Tax=Pristiophorus japonicus TaxID=55135 RepID=UPI00398E6C5B
MTDTAAAETAPPAAVAQTKAPSKKKAAAPRSGPAGPRLGDQILKVVADGKDRRGMSLAAIKKALAAKGVDVEKRGFQIRSSIKKNVMNGSLKQIKGTGASGSFKIANTDPQGKVGKKVKKPAAKKATAKKSPVKKAAVKKSPAKKTAAKKSPAKKAAVKKSPAKKAAAKKTSTKKAPTAKKTVKGPTGKKAAAKKPKSPKKVKAAKKVENPRLKATSKSAKAKKAAHKNIQGITKPAIRRLARRGGVKRISGLIYEETRGVLKVFLENVIKDAVTYTEHVKRKTVTAMDVVYALKRQGRILYGFGG